MVFDLMVEPAGQTYCDLVAFALTRSSAFTLVWRNDFGEHGRGVERRLAPLLLRTTTSDRWPGTQLFGGTATVRWYRAAPAALPVLTECAGLYSWLATNDRPEDLAFYESGERCWLGSIAHERDAFIDANPVALAQLRDAVPGLRISQGEAEEDR